MFDIVMFDDGNLEGYDLINPEGEHYLEYRIQKEYSPGYYELLAAAEQHVRDVSERRSILESEAARVYRREG